MKDKTLLHIVARLKASLKLDETRRLFVATKPTAYKGSKVWGVKHHENRN